MKTRHVDKSPEKEKARQRGQQARKPRKARMRQTRHGVLVEPESNPLGADGHFTKP